MTVKTLLRRDFARTASIVIAYTIVFFGLLPRLLWETGGLLDRVLALEAFDPQALAPLAVLLVFGGMGLMLVSMWLLRVDGRGWPISHLPPTRLVTRGPYAVLRHPIYVGYTTAFAGVALLSGSIGRAAGATGILIVAWNLYAAVFEEPRLRARFAGTSGALTSKDSSEAASG